MDDDHLPARPGRVGRAIALMAVSVLAIGLTAVAYAQPRLLSGSSQRPASTSPAVAAYQLSALDFVDRSTGWVVAELPSHDFVVLRTTDGGRSWTRQVSGTEGDRGEYARFFDRLHGVVVVLGPQAALLRTLDGGKTWSADAVREGGGDVISAEFIDAQHGWLVVQSQAKTPGTLTEALYRTSDGGRTWVDLGDPLLTGDWAFRVVFASTSRGWLYSLSSRAYAYTTVDGGASWNRMPLPAPRGGWLTNLVGSPVPSQFFVAAHPTAGSGVVATVVPVAPLKGRSVDRGVIVGYPPLRVRAFDGGVLVTNVYSTFGDVGPYRYSAILSGPSPSLLPAAPSEVELSSLDGGSSWRIVGVPTDFGTIAYADAINWWWIGAGASATTSDGGVTWTEIRSAGMRAPLPGSLRIIDHDHAWFAGVVGTTPILVATDDGGHGWRTVGLPRLTPAPA